LRDAQRVQGSEEMAATKPLGRDILVSKQSVFVTLRDVGGGHRARARSCHPAHPPSLTEGRHSGARRRSLLRPAMLDCCASCAAITSSVCRALYRTIVLLGRFTNLSFCLNE